MSAAPAPSWRQLAEAPSMKATPRSFCKLSDNFVILSTRCIPMNSRDPEPPQAKPPSNGFAAITCVLPSRTTDNEGHE
jgi:hypothetical protein